MNRTYSIAEARNDLSNVVRQAEAGQPVTLSRRGKPVAVVLAAASSDRVSDADVEARRTRIAQTIAELRRFREGCRTGRIDLRAMIEAGRR